VYAFLTAEKLYIAKDEHAQQAIDHIPLHEVVRVAADDFRAPLERCSKRAL
jgi:hypothetical protein